MEIQQGGGIGPDDAVTSLNGLVGAVELVPGAGISITELGQDITITATGDVSVSLSDVSANSTTAPLSLYTMTSTIPVEFRSSDGNSILQLSETNEQILAGASATFGSASLPHYSFLQDPNTGIYNMSADNLGFTTGGTLRATINSTGLILSGSNTPAINFGLDNTTANLLSFDSTTATTQNVQLRLFRLTNTSGASTGVTIHSADGTAGVNAFLGAKGNSYMNAVAGNFGIGLATGLSKLHVQSTAEQFRTSYDASNYATHTVTSAGVLTINTVGTAPVTQLANAGTLTFWTTNGASGFRSTHVGYGSGESGHTGDSRTALGYRAARSGTGSDIISIGAAANYNGQNFSYSLFIGSSGNSSTGMQNTAANQAVIGMPNGNGYTTFYLGQGVSAVTGTPTGTTIYGTPGTTQGATVNYGSGDGSGTDKLGGNTVIFGGRATGNAAGGDIIFQTSNAGASSATIQTLTTKMTLTELGNFGVGVSPTHRLDAYISSSSTGVSTIYGLRDIPSGTISSGSSINGIQGQLTVSGSTTITTITATGGNFIAEHDGSSTVHALAGLRGWARTNAASTGVLASAYSLYAVAPANSQAGNTITNAYSLYIESPTAGTTLNYGLYQTGTANNYFGGNVGIGINTPAYSLDIIGTAYPQLVIADSKANATNKYSMIGFGHYTASEEPIGGFYCAATNGVSQLSIGGGAGQMNAVTEINMYTAADATTIVGTSRLTIDATRISFALPVKLQGYAVGSLPAGAVGDIAYVNNATVVPAKGVAPVAGGTAVGVVFYDGAAWVGI